MNQTWSYAPLGNTLRATFPSNPVEFLAVRSLMTTLTIVINVVSMTAMVIGVLLHSGRGGGLSDMFGGGGAAALGSAAAERNLNRITMVFALVWVMSVIALSIFLA